MAIERTKAEVDTALLDMAGDLSSIVEDWREVHPTKPAHPMALLHAVAELTRIAVRVEAIATGEPFDDDEA